MDFNHIISLKEQGKKLSYEQIKFMIDGFVSGNITKQDMGRFLVAIYKNSLCKKETYYLCDAMIAQSKNLDLSCLENTVDKHSTGGISDSTTLIVVPLFALLGYSCLKMSGGALAHTGGTADKIKIFKGLKNDLSLSQAIEIAKNCGGCFITQSDELALADKKIYSLRNEIDAVMNIPLIATSIMSKKIACGAQNIVLDVKFGNGALLKTKQEARKLGRLMKFLGECYGKNVAIVYGEMNQPLGKCVGDFMEVYEVIQTLKNAEKSPLLKHSIDIVSKIAKRQGDRQFKKQCFNLVKEGKVLEKLKQIVSMQGGSVTLFSLDIKPWHDVVFSKNEGTLTKIDCERLGNLDHEMKKVSGYLGFKILKRLGDTVEFNEPIFEVFFENETEVFELGERLLFCLEVE